MMSKKKRSSQKKKSINKSSDKQIQKLIEGKAETPVMPEKKKTKKSKKFDIEFWIAVIGVIAAVIAAIPALNDIRDRYFVSSKEKYDRDNFEENDLEPIQVTPTSPYNDSLSFLERPPVFLTTPKVDSLPKFKGLIFRKMPNSEGTLMLIGKRIQGLSYEELEEGTQIPVSQKCPESVIYLLLRGDRLYISAEFKDLQKEQHIGTIEYNHWRIYKPNLLNWNYDDYHLEVRDKQNNIVCSVSTDKNIQNFLSGYCISPTSISIVGENLTGQKIDTCFLKSDPSWKQKSEIEISKIKSLYSK